MVLNCFLGIAIPINYILIQQRRLFNNLVRRDDTIIFAIHANSV